jgi:hypothetical protein
MAIKVNNVTVIDNVSSQPVFYAQGSVGSASSIFTSTGGGVRWRNINDLVAGGETYLNYFTIDTTSANYGALSQTYVSTSSNDNIDLSSTDLYGLFSSTGATTMSINANGQLVYTI